MNYFQKGYYRKGRGPSLGSPTGNSSPDRWEGSGYFDLILKKDTLHFKQEIIKDDEWHSAIMSPYSPPGLYLLLYEQPDKVWLFANDSFRLYRIKKRGK